MTDITDSKGNPVEVPAAPALTVEQRLAALENFVEQVAAAIAHLPFLKEEIEKLKTRIYG